MKKGNLGSDSCSGSVERNSFSTSSLKFNKKGQVTLFIIVGIILLFAFAGIMYLTKVGTKQTILSEGEPVISSVPQELKPIRSFTDNCLTQVAKRGLLILGSQGGYIYPDVLGEYSITEPTDGVGLDLQPTKIPYWHYNSEKNKAGSIRLNSLRPKLYFSEDPQMSIEAQLARYVNEQINNCLNNYSSFLLQGYKIDFPESLDARKVETQVGEDSVNFLLTMRVDASKGEVQEEMNKFYIKIPLKLKNYYDLASTIADAEKNVSFLERQSLSLISSFAGLEKNNLPPMEMMTFERVATNFWSVPEVKNNLISLLNSYTPMLQVYSAHNLKYYDYPVSELSPLYQQEYNNMIIPINGADDVEVRFDYFGWNPYFNTNDQQGIIRPQQVLISQWFVTIGEQRYYTVYDLSYPVVVTIDDPLAFNNEGYQFLFGLEANIRNNDVVKADKVLPQKVSSFSQSMACQKQHRDTQILRSVVVDSYTKEPLDNVRIGFSIPETAECEIGQTNIAGVVEDRYPSVVGGVINLIKEGYQNTFYPLDTYYYKDDTLNSSQKAIVGYAVEDLKEPVLQMNKIKRINVSVKKEQVYKCLTPLECDYTEDVTNELYLGSGYNPGWVMYGGPAAVAGLSLGYAVEQVIKYRDISCKPGKRQCYSEPGLEFEDIIKKLNTSGGLSFFNSYFQKDVLGTIEPPARLIAQDSLSYYNDYYASSKKESLSDKESVLFTLTKVRDIDSNVLTGDHVVSFVVKGNQSMEIELVPGIYKVDAILTLNDDVYIPKDERSMRFTIINSETELKYTLNESKMNKSMTGRVIWDDKESYLTVNPDDLYNSNNLEMYILSQDIQKVPLKTVTFMRQCKGVLCPVATHFLGIGGNTSTSNPEDVNKPTTENVKNKLLEECVVESCSQPIAYPISGRVQEDLQLFPKLENISKMPEVRSTLEPKWFD